MNRSETVDLLAVVAGATRRTIGEADVNIWHAVLEPDEIADAMQAVRDHLRDCPGAWIDPGHIHQRCRAKVRDRLDKAVPISDGPRNPMPAALRAGRDMPERNAKATSGRCPHCGAAAGVPCVNRATGVRMRTIAAHPSRLDAAGISMNLPAIQRRIENLRSEPKLNQEGIR